MVWSTTQSALYSDLSRYYKGEKTAPDQDEIEPRKFEHALLEKCNEDKAESPCENECDLPRESCRGDPPKSAPRPRCENCPRRRPRQSAARDPLSQIFSDKDKVLIAGLILLLTKQGADQKLILALAFVLLS